MGFCWLHQNTRRLLRSTRIRRRVRARGECGRDRDFAGRQCRASALRAPRARSLTRGLREIQRVQRCDTPPQCGDGGGAGVWKSCLRNASASTRCGLRHDVRSLMLWYNMALKDTGPAGIAAPAAAAPATAAAAREALRKSRENSLLETGCACSWFRRHDWLPQRP